MPGKLPVSPSAIPKCGLRPGPRDCLRCNKRFGSWDRILNRICPRCHKRQEPVYVPTYTRLQLKLT